MPNACVQPNTPLGGFASDGNSEIAQEGQAIRPYRVLVSINSFHIKCVFCIIETSAAILILWQCYASRVFVPPAAHPKLG